MEKSTNLGGPRRQAATDESDSAIAAEDMGRHLSGTAAMSADVAYRGLIFLAPTLRLPKGTRYVVRMPDDDSLIVYLVSDRKWKQWPCWRRISSLIACKHVVENTHPGRSVPQRRLYF